METLGLLLDGFSTSLSLFNIMIVVAGVTANNSRSSRRDK